MHPQVDQFINNLNIWQKETELIRSILLECKLEEDFKWSLPCYTHNDKNIIVVQPFKKYFALLFPKGYLLSDPKKVLVKTGPNTKVGRQLRFENITEIKKLKTTLKVLVKEAISLEKEKEHRKD